MSKKRRLSIKWGIMIVVAGLVVIQTGAFADQHGLGFPFEPSEVINELMSFGIPEWSQDNPDEDHCGIDLIPKYDPFPFNFNRLHKVKVVAPTEGTIRAIWAFDSGDDGVEKNKDICVILEMNEHWSIILMFEPKTRDSLRGAVEEQVRSITVKAGQYVKKGDEIGYLIVGGTERYYPHVHYALMYKESDKPYSYFEVLSDIDAVPNLDPREIGLPRRGFGSPWNPKKLDLPKGSTAAFFCPYEFSTPLVKNIFHRILENSEFPCGPCLGKCSCVCIYDRCCDGKCWPDDCDNR